MIKAYNIQNVYNSFVTNHTPKFSYIEDDLTQHTETIKFLMLCLDGIKNKGYTIKKIIALDKKIQKLSKLKDSNAYNRFKDYQRYLKSLAYDMNTQEQITQPKPSSVVYEHDKNNYNLVNKQTNYKDVSIFQILKILFVQHKLNKFEYKQTIHRLQNKQPIKPKVKALINCYLNTIKSHVNKNSMESLKRKEDLRNFEIIKHNNNSYKVVVKQNYNNKIYAHSYFNDTAKLKELSNNLINEFQNRLINANKLMFSHNSQ